MNLANINEALKKHPAIYNIIHEIGIRCLQLPVVTTSLVRQLGFCNKNYKTLATFKNLHDGERCFLIANGPSLTSKDLDFIKNEYSFGCNKIFFMFSKTDWRPDYYCILDKRYIERSQDEILEQIHCPIFTNDIVYKKLNNQNKQKRVIYAKQFYYTKFKPWTNLLSYTYATKQGTIMSFVLAVAIYMGFKEIFIIGMDHTATISGNHFEGHKEDEELTYIHKQRMNQNHWDNNHWANQTEEEMRLWKVYADNHGIKIYNATRGGKLEVFPRVNLDEIIE